MEGFKPPGYCPNCGEWVEEGATSCDSCGSCPRTGWSEDVAYDGLGIEEEDRAEAREGNSSGKLLWGVVLLLIVFYVFVMR